MLTYKVNDRVLSVKLTGDIDHHSVIAIRERIDEILFEEDIIKLVFDLSETSFMDSSGLGLILGRYRKCSEMGIEVAVSGVNDRTEKVIRLSGIDKFIKVSRYSSEDPKGQNVG